MSKAIWVVVLVAGLALAAGAIYLATGPTSPPAVVQPVRPIATPVAPSVPVEPVIRPARPTKMPVVETVKIVPAAAVVENLPVDPVADSTLVAPVADGRERLAVVPVQILGAVHDWDADAGQILADAIVSEIDSSRYQLFERARLSALLVEKDLGVSDLVDAPSQAAALGRLAGVQYLVLGTLGRLGGHYYLSARVVDCRRGRIGARGYATFSSIADWPEKIPELVNLIGLRGAGIALAPVDGADLLDEVNPAAEFKVTLRTVDGKRAYAEGELIQFEVTAERDCFVTLVAVDPTGEQTLLLPNRWQRRAFVRANKPLRIPSAERSFRFPVQPPHGMTRVKLIATRTPLRLAGVNERAIARDTFLTLPAGAKAVGVTGDEARLGDLHRPDHWATAELMVVTYDPRQQPAPPRAQQSAKPARHFQIGPSPGDMDANDRILSVWRSLRRGKLTPPPALLTPARVAPGSTGELLIYRVGARRGSRIIVDTQDLAGQVRQMSADASVAGVAENIRVHSFSLPPTTLAPVQWGLQNDYANGVDIGWSRVKRRARRIRPVKIGLVDAAVDFGDPRLAGAAWTNPAETPGNGIDDDGTGFADDIHGFNFIANSPQLTGGRSAFQHGSFVASIIGGRPTGSDADVIGVCPNAEIISAVALAADRPVADPWRAAGDLACVIDGLRYAADHGAKVINCSFGAAVTREQLRQIDSLPIWDDLERRGVLLVCAVGNANADIDCKPVFPGCLPRSNVLTVMAVDAVGRLGRAANRGRRWVKFTNFGAEQVDLAAPGTLILGASRRGDVQLLSGTSYSAAFATAAAAMVWGQNPAWGHRQVIAHLCNSASRRQSLRGRCRSEGVLNLAAALGQR